jgi:hypothetical protein
MKCMRKAKSIKAKRKGAKEKLFSIIPGIMEPVCIIYSFARKHIPTIMTGTSGLTEPARLFKRSGFKK